MIPAWLTLARELQALAQTGLTYSRDPYDTQRYQRLQEMAAEVAAGQTGLPAATLLQAFAAQPGYATPKVDVRGAVIRDGKVLLVQERSDQGWCLPGGWADVGATPSAMVEREVWEEAGLRVTARKLLGVYDANRVPDAPLEFFHAYKLIFWCEAAAGRPAPGPETLAADYFAFDALPPLSRQRTSAQHLAEVQAHLRDPGRPAAFD